MKRIQLWAIRMAATGPIAEAVAAHENVATEAHLEEILVHSPALLGEGVTIVARQAPTEGGPLDLLGIDESGRLILFELKRGTLTREAVAQALDYISDLAGGGPDRIARLVEQSSGRLGVEKIDDFEEWYAERFPDSEGVLASSPKMTLVGLGVDARALRIVDYLAGQGIAIELLTFHAFDSAGTTFLARQVESAPQGRSGAFLRYKATNVRNLQENARALGCSEFFEQVTELLSSLVQGPHHPAKGGYTFVQSFSTADGKRGKIACVRLRLNKSRPGSLRLTVFGSPVKAAPRAIEHFQSKFADITSRSARDGRLEILLLESEWERMSGDVNRLVQEVTSAVAGGLHVGESESGDSEET